VVESDKGGGYMELMGKILKAFRIKEENIDVKVKEEISEKENKTIYSKEYQDYYGRIQAEKENNLNIRYKDVSKYDGKPFSLKKERFISDEHFTAIELKGKNYEKSLDILNEINKCIEPFSKYLDETKLPSAISTEYILNRKLPESHLRLTPYTASKSENELPFYLWLTYFGNYGNEYLYIIYFDQNGEIKKGDLSIHGNNGKRTSYQIQIRRTAETIYVKKIDKTLYEAPYGTKHVYKSPKKQ
jgi:hypothetical protein